jgi:hypothetical protein
MTKDEALKMALEAFGEIDWSNNSQWQSDRAKVAIANLKEALAESEPNYKKALEVWLDKTEWVQETVKPHELGMHRADVLKQRIEEALAQPEQEPVAWRYRWSVEGGNWVWNYATYIERQKDDRCEPLYTTPPQRTWIGLTDAEIGEIYRVGWAANMELARAIEAKLKEKNL